MFEKKVLDHGFVRVVDTMGDDNAIVQAARVSYGEGTKTPSDDRSLIRYLMRHRHSTPFEMCEIKLHVKIPVSSARQWIRHRTASINEESARYSIVRAEFYVPQMDRLKKQSAENKQGSSDEIVLHAEELHELFVDSPKIAHNNYKTAIDSGVSREVARELLTENRYTQFYWKIDLHNLFHFLQLRLDKHAQWEIRQYAEAIAEFVKTWVPYAWEAFVDYRLEAVTLSRMEYNIVRSSLVVVDNIVQQSWDPSGPAWNFDKETMLNFGMSNREIKEFLEKWT